MMAWQDIDDRRFEDFFRVIQRHPVGGAGAAIMAGDIELLMTKFGHHVDQILGHGAE